MKVFISICYFGVFAAAFSQADESPSIEKISLSKKGSFTAFIKLPGSDFKGLDVFVQLCSEDIVRFEDRLFTISPKLKSSGKYSYVFLSEKSGKDDVQSSPFLVLVDAEAGESLKSILQSRRIGGGYSEERISEVLSDEGIRRFWVYKLPNILLGGGQGQ